MFQFFTEDFAGLSAETLNWIALGVCILVGLLLLLALFRMFRGSGLVSNRRNRNARLAVTDATSIGDDRRKLVLVRRDEVEHLLLIGGPSDLVIESNIVRTASAAPATRATVIPAAQKSYEAPTPPPPPSASTSPAPTSPPKLVSKPEPAQVAAPAQVAPTPAASPSKPAAETTTASTSGAAPAIKTVLAATAATGAAILPGSSIAASQAKEDSSVETAGSKSGSPKAEAPNVEIAPAKTPPAISEPVVISAAQKESTKPLDPVQEMDALLNEITTDK